MSDKPDENHEDKIPFYWQIPGYFFGLPLLLFLIVIASNQYLFPVNVGRIGLIFIATLCLAYRLVFKRAAHTLFWLLLFLIFYNWIMILGGFFFLGYRVFLYLASAMVICYFALIKVPMFMRFGIAIIFIAVVGMFALKFEKEFDKKRCANEKDKVSAVFYQFDSDTHCYDFAITEAPPLLAATFGLRKKIKLFALDTLTLSKTIKADQTGIQRLTPHPDGTHLLAPAWGHGEEESALALISTKTGKINRAYQTPGCQSPFETVVDEKRSRFYLLCESTHNILSFKIGETEPERTLVIPGMNSYDMAMDSKGQRLFVTDWLSPFLFVIDLESFTLEHKVNIGWTSFGIALSPDGNKIFVARPIASEVVVLNSTTFAIEHRLDVGFGPRDLEIDPVDSLIFVGNYFTGVLDVFHIKTMERISSHYAGRLLRGLKYDKDSQRIFIAVGCGLLWAKKADLLDQ